MTISFSASKYDTTIIRRIAARAFTLAIAVDGSASTSDLMMDITATHCNGCPLDLDRLLAGSDFDFTHDVFGIQRHLNRETGKLEDFFLPRYATKQTA